MFNYARSDTHFLLHIYDILRNELLEKSKPSEPDGDLIDIVLRKSKEEALQRYERPFYDVERGTGSSGWYNLLSYTPALFKPEQFAVFRAVHHWRDTMARQEDESLNMIMPKHVIYNIAREMPMEMAALLGCSQPVSIFVRSRAGELLSVVKQAKVEGTTGSDLLETFRAFDATESRVAESTIPFAGAASAVVAASALPEADLNELSMSSGMNVSTFWGPTLGRYSHGGVSEHGSPNVDSIRLALPLPQLTAEVFTDPDSMKDAALHDLDKEPSARREHAYVKDQKPNDQKPHDEEIFVVRQLGGPRKRKAADMEDSVEHPEPVLEAGLKTTATNGGLEHGVQQEISQNYVNGDQKNCEKAKRRAERKAQKKLEKKRRKLDEQQDAQNGGEEAAFDYANAPSILHAKETSHARAGVKEAFNPYLKSLDTSKGMRHNKRDIPGKSLTYKS